MTRLLVKCPIYPPARDEHNIVFARRADFGPASQIIGDGVGHGHYEWLTVNQDGVTALELSKEGANIKTLRIVVM
jgi:hypothetical protein